MAAKWCAFGLAVVALGCGSATAAPAAHVRSQPAQSARGKYGAELSAAVEAGALERVRELLAAGADWRVLDQDGLSLLHLAARANHPELVRSLIARGLPLSGASHLGTTPLMLAARRGALDAARVLLDAGAPVDQRGLEGMSALHQATFKEQRAMVELLLDRGATIDGRDDAGDTALHVAVGREPALMTLILARGADPYKTNERGYTPLDWAALRGATQSVQALLQHGVREDVETRDGYTALEYASNAEVFEMLRDARWARSGPQAPAPLSPFLVRAAVDERRGEVAACYEAALLAAPLETVVHLQIARDGKIENFWAVPTLDRAVYSCVQRALGKLKFPHSSRAGNFSCPLNLGPRDLPPTNDPADAALSRL